MALRSFMLVLAAVAGCGGGRTNADLAPAPTDLAMLAGKLCNDARADRWTLPATAMAKDAKNGAFVVSLVASAASPPLIGDLTTWTLQLTDASGAMVSGATFMTRCPDGSMKPVCPWMPDHGHGTSAIADVTPGSAPGQYTIGPLYLFMAGYWTITATMTRDAITDSIVYSVCLSDA